MLESQWSLEAKMEVPGFRLEVRNAHWPQPLETRDCIDRPQLVLSLSHRPAHSRVRYDDLSPRGQFTEIGDLVMFAAEQPFCGRSEGGPQRLLTCQFKADARVDFANQCSLNEMSLFAALDIKDKRIRVNLARVAQETLRPGFGAQTLVESLMIASMVDISRYLETRKVERRRHHGGLAAWQMRRITDRIHSSEDSSPSIGDLAKLCGISERHLMRGFKTMTGTTLHTLVSQARLEKAKRLLLASRMPLKTISWHLGFAQPSSFTCAFQRDMGMTPTEFRARSGIRED